MALEGRILDLASSYRTGMNTFDGFWNRSRGYLTGKDNVKGFLEKAEEQGCLDQEKARLERIAREEFDAVGKKYFNTNTSKYIRYGGLTANVIGAITAGSAIFALAAGAPITALGGIGLGLAYVLGGGLANTTADVYDAARLKMAMAGKDESSGVLGYLKKGAKGLWEAVKSPFRKDTAKPLAEGLAENALAYKGAGFASGLAGVLGTAALPYVQTAAMAGGAALAYHRGGKKFDDVLASYLHDRIEKRLIEENENVLVDKHSAKVIPLKKRLQETPDYAHENVYAASRSQAYDDGKVINLVPPRSGRLAA